MLVNIKEPSQGWLVGFLFAVSFVGLFTVVPLRKIMVIDYKLTYPSGTATALLINSFHTPQGAILAKKQVSVFNFFGASFLWSFFQWFFAAGDDCGFKAFPMFGLKAYQNQFFFDFSATYVVVGMKCPYITNISLLIGAIISWGVLWPFITNKSGIWYDASLSAGSLKGVNGYKVFIPISIILSDGLFNFLMAVFRTLSDMYRKHKQREAIMPVVGDQSTLEGNGPSYDDQRRKAFFLKDQIPTWVAV